MTDPTRTYTKLSSDTVFPFDQIEQFKAWHDATLVALQIKDEKIRDLESQLKRLAENNQDTWTRLPYLLEDLKVAKQEIANLTKELAELQRQSTLLLLQLPTAPSPFPQSWTHRSTDPRS